jgi:hypothetical protein
MRGSRARTYEPTMRMLSAFGRRLTPDRRDQPWGLVVLAVAMPLLTPGMSFAAEAHCLNPDEQRAAIALGKAVPLGSVLHSLHRAPREVVKARLCQEPDRLIYQLTLLGRDGKVKVATVDATSGAVVGER